MQGQFNTSKNASTTGPRPRHTPIRTCVACRATDEKRDLLRVVRQPDLTVRYDPKGKLSGRGAYVCATPRCIGTARKQKKLERSLKVNTLPDELWPELLAQVKETKETAVVSSGVPASDGTAPNTRETTHEPITQSKIEARAGQEAHTA